MVSLFFILMQITLNLRYDCDIIGSFPFLINNELNFFQMNDAMDAGMDTADDVESADKIYSQICDEIGVELYEEHHVAKG